MLSKRGYLYFTVPGLLLGPRPWPWPPMCIYRPWHQICIYQPWHQICTSRPWPPIWIYRFWPPICVYPKFLFTGSTRLSLHIPTLSPQFVFTGPGLWFVRTQAAKLIYPLMLNNVINSIIVYRSKYWSCTEKMVFFKITALHSCQLELRPKPLY